MAMVLAEFNSSGWTIFSLRFGNFHLTNIFLGLYVREKKSDRDIEESEIVRMHLCFSVKISPNSDK